MTSLLRLSLIAATVVALLATTGLRAEPYIAVQKGLQCSACHTHPAGGGKRNAYGNVFAQTELPASRVGGEAGDLWTGEIAKFLSVGANLRAGYRYVDTPNNDEVSEFDVFRGNLFIEAHVVPNRLSVYIDQQLAPNGSLNREAYIKLRDSGGNWSLTAGQFYLPYGLRLQDDTAFIRQVTGINFTNPDRGVQVGFDNARWSTQLSLSNGSGGGAESDTGKQVSFVVQFVEDRWRAGASINVNDVSGNDRQMQNVFAGLRTGPIAWLGEVDWIRDELTGGGTRDSFATLIEANWQFRRGHNLKLTQDYFDPDDDMDEDEVVRFSVFWEYTPMQFLQARFGVRTYDGEPQIDVLNRDEFFAEIHGFF